MQDQSGLLKIAVGFMGGAVVALIFGWAAFGRGGVTPDQVEVIIRGALENSRTGSSSRPAAGSDLAADAPALGAELEAQRAALAELADRVDEILWRVPAEEFDSWDLAAAPADAWPMFRGNLQQTGVSLTELPEELEVVWQYDAGDAIDTTVAIVGGLVFFGAFDGSFHAVNFETGEPQWVRTFHPDEFAAESEDAPTTPPARAFYAPAIFASAAVSDGRVFFGDEMGNVYALSAWNGETLWKVETLGEIRSSPTVVGGSVLIGSSGGTLYNFDAATGEEIWSLQTEDQIRCAPAVADGLTYVAGCDSMIHGIDIRTGVEVMTLPIGSQMGSTPALYRGRLYAGIYDYAVIGVDLREPRILWAHDPEPKDFPFEASAAITRDRVVIGGKDKIVYCLDMETGEQIWTFPTRAAVLSSPVIVGDRVFIGSGDGSIYELDLNTGEERWKFETGMGLSASPAVASGRLIIGNHAGILYCFGERGDS